MYKEIFCVYENKVTLIMRLFDSAQIPFDPANTDYQAFLLWKAQGNEPLPADEGTQ